MYNEEQKMRFIDSVGFSDSNKSWAKDVFNSVENAERDNNKDISVMSGNEVGSALSCSGAVSSITISNLLRSSQGTRTGARITVLIRSLLTRLISYATSPTTSGRLWFALRRILSGY